MSLRVAGRCAGAFFLLAFVSYGIGSALAGQFAGAALVVLNSAMVAAIGGLAFRALRRPRPGAAWAYLVARGAEAFLLTAGIVLLDSVGAGAADIAYQAAMLSLGLGGLPFCLALNRQRWLPRWLAIWGFAGYALLATGAAAELMGAGIGLVLAVPEVCSRSSSVCCCSLAASRRPPLRSRAPLPTGRRARRPWTATPEQAARRWPPGSACC